MNELDEQLYRGVRKAADTVSAAMARKLDGAKTTEGEDISASASV